MTNSEFNTILNDNAVVCCKFGAIWCNPCKMMQPIIEEISNEYNGKAKVFDIDVEESSDITTQYRIRNIPTILFFKDGKLSDKIVGSTDKNTITDKIDSLL